MKPRMDTDAHGWERRAMRALKRSNPCPSVVPSYNRWIFMPEPPRPQPKPVSSGAAASALPEQIGGERIPRVLRWGGVGTGAAAEEGADPRTAAATGGKDGGGPHPAVCRLTRGGV